MCEYKYALCHRKMIEKENILYTSIFLITTHTSHLLLICYGRKAKFLLEEVGKRRRREKEVIVEGTKEGN